jgi:hypothetical protein
MNFVNSLLAAKVPFDCSTQIDGQALILVSNGAAASGVVADLASLPAGLSVLDQTIAFGDVPQCERRWIEHCYYRAVPEPTVRPSHASVECDLCGPSG